jgi:hypothetical protein
MFLSSRLYCDVFFMNLFRTGTDHWILNWYIIPHGKM